MRAGTLSTPTLACIAVGGVISGDFFGWQNVLEGGLGEEGLINIGVGILAAAVSGYAAIGFLLRFLERYGTDVFSLYRIGLGGLILYGLSTGSTP